MRNLNLESNLSLIAWPPRTKVLFMGNSYVNQLELTAVLDVPDGAIRSMNYPLVREDCIQPTQNKYILVDHLSMWPQDMNSGMHVDGV